MILLKFIRRPKYKIIEEIEMCDVGKTTMELQFDDGFVMNSNIYGIPYVKDGKVLLSKSSKTKAEENLTYSIDYNMTHYIDDEHAPTQAHIGKLRHMSIKSTVSHVISVKVEKKVKI